jgi:hypothetical protein
VQKKTAYAMVENANQTLKIVFATNVLKKNMVLVANKIVLNIVTITRAKVKTAIVY